MIIDGSKYAKQAPKAVRLGTPDGAAPARTPYPTARWSVRSATGGSQRHADCGARWSVAGTTVLPLHCINSVTVPTTLAPALFDIRFDLHSAPEVIGHRGASAEAPENTLPTFEAAWNAGCTWIEAMCSPPPTTYR